MVPTILEITRGRTLKCGIKFGQKKTFVKVRETIAGEPSH